VSRAELSAELAKQVREQQIAYDRFHDAVAAYMGINRTDLRCLDLIDLRGRQTAGEISQVTGLTTGAITAMLDRLERAGYIQRVRDTGDRRRVLVELTELARKRGWEVYEPFAVQAGPMFGRFTDEQLATLRDFVRIGNEFYTEQIARLEALARETRRPDLRPSADAVPGADEAFCGACSHRVARSSASRTPWTDWRPTRTRGSPPPARAKSRTWCR